jgi:hypothetical protein
MLLTQRIIHPASILRKENATHDLHINSNGKTGLTDFIAVADRNVSSVLFLVHVIASSFSPQHKLVLFHFIKYISSQYQGSKE